MVERVISNTWWRGGLLLLMPLFAAGCLIPAGPSSPMVSTLKLQGQTAHVWRGRVWNEETVAQGTFELQDRQWLLSAWGNMDWTDSRAAEREITEYRLGALYSWQPQGSPWMLGVGYKYYGYPQFEDELDPNHRESAQEVYFKALLTSYWMKPMITVYRDIDDNEWTYATLNIGTGVVPGHMRSLLGNWTIDVQLGYGDRNWHEVNLDPDLDAGLTDVTTTIFLPLQSQSAYKITPYASYMYVVDDDLQDALEAAGEETDLWYGGVSIFIQL